MALKTTIGSKTLLPHQETAVGWMVDHELDGLGGGLLCDEMGLGKTLSVLGLCINNPKPYTLLFCPLAVVNQWVEAAKDAGLGVLTLEGGLWKPHNGWRRNKIFITNIDKLLHSKENFKRDWSRVVLDEAHQVRNVGSERYKALVRLSRKTTWCLSATPVVNKTVDVAALLHLVEPSFSMKAKKTEVEKAMMTYAMARSVEQVRETLDIFPKAAEVVEHSIDFLSKEETEFYRGVQGALQEQLKQAMYEADSNMTAIFSILLRLRQLSVHPQVYIEGKRRQLGSHYVRPDWTNDSAKVKALVDLIKAEDKPKHWVVFCQFRDEIALLEERLKKETDVGLVTSYDGSMSMEEREEVVQKTKDWVQSEPMKHQVLLLQIHCGGTGLNLQHMDRVVFMSPWWTAALMDQAVGRVLRIGQKEKVRVHHLKLTEGESMNIDKLIFEKIETKRNLCQQMLEAACREM